MNKTILYVAEEISEIYGLDLSKSKAIVEKSWFSEILRENPNYVQHYTADYWAKVYEGFISPEYRNQKYGEKVIDYLLSKNNVDCIIGETLKSSRGFWRKEIKRLGGVRVNVTYCDNTTSTFIIPKMKIDDLYECLREIYHMLD